MAKAAVSAQPKSLEASEGSVSEESPVPSMVTKPSEVTPKSGEMQQVRATSHLSAALLGLAAVLMIVGVAPAALIGFSAPWVSPLFGVCTGGAVVCAITAVLYKYLR